MTQPVLVSSAATFAFTGGTYYESSDCSGTAYLAANSMPGNVPPPGIPYIYVTGSNYQALPSTTTAMTLMANSHTTVNIGNFQQQCSPYGAPTPVLVVPLSTVAGAPKAIPPDLSALQPPFHPIISGS